MTVYVDDMRAKFGRAKFGRTIMSHMIADTDDELHDMADKIGVARKWFQGDHYDVSWGKRDRALDYGAKMITWRTCGLMVSIRRRYGWLPPSRDIEEIWNRYRTLEELMGCRPKPLELGNVIDNMSGGESP